MGVNFTIFDMTQPSKPKQDTLKRNWENAFQRWSDKCSQDGSDEYGMCGCGRICDYCTDNSYGRPCVRALNAMLREKGGRIDYTVRDFKTAFMDGGIANE